MAKNESVMNVTPATRWALRKYLMNTVRVMVVDDSPIFLDAAVRHLGKLPDIEVVAAVGSGREAVSQAEALGPDLAIVDLDMPDMSGMVTLIHLKALPVRPRVLIVSGHGESYYRILAKAGPADGFVDKRDFANDIARKIRTLFPEQTEA